MPEWRSETYGAVASASRARGFEAPDISTLLSVTAREGVIDQAKSGRRDVSADDKSKYLVVVPGDVVYNTMRMWQGVSGFSSLSGIVSPAYTVVRPNADVLDGRFLAHLMKLPQSIDSYRAYSQGLVSDTWNLKFSALASLSLGLPPLEEQRRIAEILDTIDETIQASERVIAKLWSARTGLLRDLLVAIDSLYETVPLMEMISLPSGQADPRREPFRSMTLVAPDHLVGGGRGRLLARETAEQQGAISGKYRFETGDVLYSKIRPELRKAWLADTEGLCSADMYPLKPVDELNCGYLAQVVLGDRFSRFAVSVSGRSSGMPKINREELAEFELAVPPLTVQVSVSRIAEASLRRIDYETAGLEKLRQVRSGLAADLLSGRVRTVAA